MTAKAKWLSSGLKGDLLPNRFTGANFKQLIFDTFIDS